MSWTKFLGTGVAPVAILGGGVLVAIVGCASGGGLADALLYANYEATDPPASRYFCGSRRKRPFGSTCMAKASTPSGPITATEKVEIRGWVIASTGSEYSFGDYAKSVPEEAVPEEYRFDVLLDFGWTPGTPGDAGVRAIHTVDRIHEAVTPHNQIHFGIGNQGIGSALLDPDGTVWGGAGSMVVHVEIDGWFERGRMFARCRPVGGGQQCDAGDWVASSARSESGLYWPFDPVVPPGVGSGPLAIGDYVRLVGTLWEDSAHPDRGGKGGDRGEDAKGCWCSGALGDCLEGRGRGWMEIHPVDYLARIEPPTSSPGRVEVISLCGDGAVVHRIEAPGPRPPSAASVGFRSIPDPAFTVAGSFVETVTPTPAGIEVSVSTSPSGGDDARFKRAYEVFWLDGSGARVPAPRTRVLPLGQGLTAVEQIANSCGESTLHIVSTSPRHHLSRGQSVAFTGSRLEWFCGAPNPGERAEVDRCGAGTVAVKVIRAAVGDDWLIECVGSEP